MDHKPKPQSKLSAKNQATFVRVSLRKERNADLRCTFQKIRTVFKPALPSLLPLETKRRPQAQARQQSGEVQTNYPLLVDDPCGLCQHDGISIQGLQDYVYSKRSSCH